MRPTAKAVARLANVDPSTVSRVLGRRSAKHRYDPETERRIREAARKLGYRPSMTARALRTGKTCLVGLVVADIASPFFAELAAKIERHLRSQGYRLLVVNTGESATQQVELVQELHAHPVAGLIVSPTGIDGLVEAHQAGLAVVTVDRPAPGTNLPHVGLDDAAAGMMLGSHFRTLGYRRVGVVMPDAQTDPSIFERLKGFTRGLGQEPQWQVLRHPGKTTQVATQIAQKLERVEAVVGLNLDSTLAALEVIGDKGLKIPKEIGLAGFDDFAAARLLSPGITVISQPIEEIAQHAVAMLAKAMEKPQALRNKVQHLPPTLVKRGSLRKISAGSPA